MWVVLVPKAGRRREGTAVVRGGHPAGEGGKVLRKSVRTMNL